jgi:hypothetical protein
MDRDSKKRRVITREEPSACEYFKEEDADFAMSIRRHLVSLDNALRKQWVCICQKCSGLSVRLSLPQKKDSKVETSFDVFFGVRSLSATALQEAKITIKYALARLSGSLVSLTLSFAAETYTTGAEALPRL